MSPTEIPTDSNARRSDPTPAASRRILITGGSGTVGQALVPALLQAGYAVRVFCLPGDLGAAKLPAQAEIRTGDIARPEQVAGLCEGVQTVLHLAAVILAPRDELYDLVNRQGTAHLVAEAERAGVSRFVLVSSASVCYPRLTTYGRSKRDAEELLQRSTLGWLILRPTLVIDRGGSLEYNLLLSALKRWPLFPLIAGGRCRKRPLHTDDFVAALVACASHPSLSRRVLPLSGSTTVTFAELARESASRLGVRPHFVSLPTLLALPAIAFLQILKRRPVNPRQALAGFLHDADLDNRETCQLLGIRPRTFTQLMDESFPRRTQETP
jgi:NADH dehydrogenase